MYGSKCLDFAQPVSKCETSDFRAEFRAKLYCEIILRNFARTPVWCATDARVEIKDDVVTAATDARSKLRSL